MCIRIPIYATRRSSAGRPDRVLKDVASRVIESSDLDLVGQSERELRFHYYGSNLLIGSGRGWEIMFEGRIRFVENDGRWVVRFSLWTVPSLVSCGILALILAVGLPWVIVHTILQPETPTVDCYAGVVGLVVITTVGGFLSKVLYDRFRTEMSAFRNLFEFAAECGE